MEAFCGVWMTAKHAAPVARRGCCGRVVRSEELRRVQRARRSVAMCGDAARTKEREPRQARSRSARALAAMAVLAVACIVTPNAPAHAADGAVLFETNCVGCHVGGGNILPFARSKTLKTNALKKNNLLEREAVAQLVRDGKGAMPAYGTKLSDDEIDSVAQYVLQRAGENWK